MPWFWGTLEIAFLACCGLVLVSYPDKHIPRYLFVSGQLQQSSLPFCLTALRLEQTKSRVDASLHLSSVP